MDKIALNEQQYVEEPFLRQLERLEWKVIRAGEQGKYDPAITLREGFNEVIIEKELRASLLNINRWLEDDQITDIIREITVPQSNGLIQINKEILEKLLENTSRDNRKTGERSETVRFIDFKNPEKNSFLAISQFKVNIPGTEKHIIPDIVLFINGLPLAVIECKSPYISDPIGEAVIQLMRYSNRREVKEGNEKLFWYNQILIATSRQTAKYSTITGEYEYFIEWKDPYPAKLSDIETEGSESVNSQQVLIQGILKKENLLDIIQSFIVFQEDTKGKMVKIAPRYQQYRTVLKIINRLKSDKAPNLLQAIARVNRVYKNKNGGFVVDYVGVVKHLREALAVFDKKDVEEILKVVKDDEKDIDELRYNHLQLKEFFKKYGISDINDIDACVDILVDEEIRNDFLALFRMFVKSMDRVLPKTEALQYVKDLKKFSFIGQAARNRYRDEKLSIKDASKKIRDIVDEYLISLGVDPKIPPLPIFSEKFKLKISQEKSDKAKSEELKIAIREHINDCLEEDPELYERFSEKLDKLIKEYKDNWELLAKELKGLIEEIRKGRLAEETFDFNPKSEMPFLGLIKKEVFGVKNISELNHQQIELLVQTTKDTLNIIKNEIKFVDFWNNITAQQKLKTYIASHLLKTFRSNEIFNKRASVSQRIMELAYHHSVELINE